MFVKKIPVLPLPELWQHALLVGTEKLMAIRTMNEDRKGILNEINIGPGIYLMRRICKESQTSQQPVCFCFQLLFVVLSVTTKIYPFTLHIIQFILVCYQPMSVSAH